MYSCAELQPVLDTDFIEPLELPKRRKGGTLLKIYHDGGHYIGSTVFHNDKNYDRIKERYDTDEYKLLDVLFQSALLGNMRDKKMRRFLKDGMLEQYPDFDDIDTWLDKHIKRKLNNLHSQRKRFQRKVNLNSWNYFTTFTYADEKMTERQFYRKLRRCLSNFHTRYGWRYALVFERGEKTGRLHAHGLISIPNGSMRGKLSEQTDYSLRRHEWKTTWSNSFFAKRFGKNDFDEITADELKNGKVAQYLIKYIGKTNQRIIYSRGLPTEIYKYVDDSDIITPMSDNPFKYVLFDDVINYERDILCSNLQRHTQKSTCYTQYKP